MRENANADAALWALTQRTGRGTDKLLLAILASYADKNNEAWPSQSTLAAEAEIDIKTIALGLKRLELSGLISRNGAGPLGSVKFRLHLNRATTQTQAELIPAPPPEPKPSKDRGTLEDVKAFCAELKLPESDSTWFYWKCEGNQWTNGGRPIKDWRATIRAWQAGGFFPSQKNGQTRKVGTAARRETELTRTMQEPIKAKTVVTYSNEHNGH